MSDNTSKRKSRSRPPVSAQIGPISTDEPVEAAPLSEAAPIALATGIEPEAAPIGLPRAIDAEAPPSPPEIAEIVKPAAAPQPMPQPAATAAPVAAVPMPEPELETVATFGSQAEDMFAIGRTALGVFAESQTAVARGIEAMALEAATLARNGFAAAAAAATALLGARNFADAFEVQAGFARHSIDAALDGSVRLSEIAVKASAEASRPILARLDEAWRAG